MRKGIVFGLAVGFILGMIFGYNFSKKIILFEDKKITAVIPLKDTLYVDVTDHGGWTLCQKK